MTQAIETAALTVAGGILVFIFGQVAMVLFIERIRIQARTIEEISEAIVHYAREYSSPREGEETLTAGNREKLRERAAKLRSLAARLRASAVTLRYYRFFEILRLVLPRKRVIAASQSLMGLSNVIPPNGAEDIKISIRFRKEIEENLDIEIPQPKP